MAVWSRRAARKTRAHKTEVSRETELQEAAQKKYMSDTWTAKGGGVPTPAYQDTAKQKYGSGATSVFDKYR